MFIRLTKFAFGGFCSLANNAPERLGLIEQMIGALDLERKLILQRLLMLMTRLNQHSHANLMDEHNLAVVFAPNLLPSPPDASLQVCIFFFFFLIFWTIRKHLSLLHHALSFLLAFVFRLH